MPMLSNKRPPRGHLLKKLPNGYKTEGSEEAAADRGVQTAKKPILKPVPNIADLPLSTDDEEETEELQPDANGNSIVDSSEDDLPARGTIQSTAFKSNKDDKGIKGSRPTHSKNRGTNGADLDEGEAFNKRRKMERALISSLPRSSQSTGPDQDKSFLSSFSSQGSQPRRLKQTFGSSKAARRSIPKFEAEARTDRATGRPKLKNVEDLPESPEKSQSNAKFRDPAANLPDSPTGDRAGPRIEDPRRGSSSPCSDSDGTLDDQRLLQQAKSRRGRVIAPRRKKGTKRRESSPEAANPKPTFRMPVGIPDRIQLNEVSDEDIGSVTDPGESDAFEEAVDTDVQEQTTKEQEVPEALCPWCKEVVSALLLEEFSKGNRLNVRQQERFCQRHRRVTAKVVWEEKGYPEIAWDALETRFYPQHDYLMQLVNGRSSFYGDILAQKIREGKGRRLKQEENLTPGYYGPRGFNVMCDHLVGEFQDLLKQQAMHNIVISGRGPAAFIQSVLVPELAVKLIMEDLHVDAATARDIIEDSKQLGELLNDDG